MRTPVVLLPGAFGQDMAYWNVWEYFLARDGFRVHRVTFPLLTLTDLRRCADVLSDRVDTILRGEKADEVCLVGHSMGGLIARHYLKFLGGGAKTRRLCCLATPHHGTWAAATGPIFKGTRQIIPGSRFLRELNDPSRDHGGVPILNVWSRWDGIILPAESALLDAPGVENRMLSLGGHWGMLVSRRAYGWVRDAMGPAATRSGGRNVEEPPR